MKALVASSVLTIACCGCCCLRIPTFGFYPEIDEAAVVAELKAKPFVVDHICETEATCAVVEGATVEVMPVSWNPFTGTVVALVQTEALCQPSDKLLERLEPFLCKGLLAVIQTSSPSGPPSLEVTEETLFGGPSVGGPRGTSSGGGDFDWD